MTTAFISDLHLSEAKPHLSQLLNNFLDQYHGKLSALYILGDLFEVWIGDDDASEFNSLVIERLRKFAESGVKIFFLPGNRDFLIGKKFARAARCTILRDPTIIELNQQKILLTHGDAYCTDDKKHQAFRRKTRNFLFRWFILRQSLSKRRTIAANLRAKSKLHQQNAPQNIMDVNNNAYKSALKKSQANILIHGHTHRPAIEFFNLQTTPSCRIVLGDWDEQGNALIYHPDDTKELIWFK